MSVLTKLTAHPATAALTPAEKIAFRLGSLLLTLFALAALAPLAYLVTAVLDLSPAGPLEMTLVSLTWLASAYAVAAGFFCEAWPSPRAYIAVISSCAAALLLWLAWIIYGLGQMH